MDYSKLCLKCMHERQNEKCEYCGFDFNDYILKPNAIAAPSVLKGRYLLGIPLGIGGFGITYIALDLKVGGVCAVKEYMPDTVSFRNGIEQSVSISESKLDGYRYGLNRFIEEAQMLMKFSKSKNIINVFDCFEENNTAYYVMEYLNGCDLRTFTNDFKIKMDFEFGLQCMQQVMNGLEELHSKDVIHRDISPDNIYITKTGDVKILDFGAARYSLTQKERNLSVILKMSYAPLEQYSTKIAQGPWTDIYALGSTFYHLFSGVQLPEATERTLGENVKYLKDYNQLIPDYFCKVISKAISLQANERYHSIAEMRADLQISQNQQYKESIHQKVNAGKVDFNSVDLSNTLVSKNIFGRRIIAYIIDLILSILIAFGFILLIGVVLEVMDMLDEVGFPIIIAILFSTPIVLALLNSALESSKLKGTIGKRIIGIQTINIYGGILSSKDSIKRNFLKLLGVILLLTEKNGLFLHEIKSNSKVVGK